MTDRRVADAVAAMGGVTAAKLGLRFDRVVVRVLDHLQRSIETQAREGVSVALTLTAPLRAPGKTAAALQQEVITLLRTGRPGDGRSLDVHGNYAELRLVRHPPGREARVLGFVHNAGGDAATILALAERWLRSGG